MSWIPAFVGMTRLEDYCRCALRAKTRYLRSYIIRYKGVLFDLDGTLLDTLEDLADAANSMLARAGFPTHPLDEYRYFVGDGVVNLVTRILPAEARDQATIQLCLAMQKEEYNKRWDNKTRPYPGIEEMLTALRRKGVKLTIFSNKPHEFTLLTVQKLLSGHEFDIVQGITADTPVKPNPAGAMEIAKKLGLEPNEFLYLGDTNTDMQTAVAAGMYPVGALWGFRTGEELLANGAARLIEKPGELVGMIE